MDNNGDNSGDTEWRTGGKKHAYMYMYMYGVRNKGYMATGQR